MDGNKWKNDDASEHVALSTDSHKNLHALRGKSELDMYHALFWY